MQQEYDKWISKVTDEQLLSELRSMDGGQIKDAFYKNLEFGTGGLRGVIGAGLNRMNIYTVGKATQGICDYLLAAKGKKGGASVAIAYDSRIKSTEFAKTAASVFAGNGIKAHIFSELMPTPVLSYAVRNLGCDAGVIVTASHNPAQYNGYKVYGADGCQITLDMANAVLERINAVDIFGGIKSAAFEDALKNGMIKYIPDSVLDGFLSAVEGCAINRDVYAKAGLSVVYTPLNGTGNKPVRAIMSRMGLKNFTVVPEQEKPDGNFTTCRKPNPEERGAFAKALELAAKTQPDILLATDPDCDRVGVAVRSGGDYVLLNGNETGCLLLHYILSQRRENGTLPINPVVIKTIVTSRLADEIAADFGARIIDTLTGFKFIGEQIGLLEKSGVADRYVFGFEESYGCLPGTYVRDKDAVAASMLICEMASFYKGQELTLLDVMGSLYGCYGCYRHKLLSFAFEGTDGMGRMKGITSRLRKGVESIAGLTVMTVADYQSSVKTNIATGEKSAIKLPKSDVVVFELENGCEVVVRPSGTEPKLKCYLTAKGKEVEATDAVIVKLENGLSTLIADGKK
jgi:phosphoglucomutase